MSLNQFPPIGIHRDTYRFAWLRRATLHNRRAMNKNIAALLGVGHPQLTNLRPVMSRNVKQSAIADLSAHLGVERCAINNYIYFVRFLARKNRFDDCFRLHEIVSEEFRRLQFEIAFSNTDFLLLLCLARALTLLLH